MTERLGRKTVLFLVLVLAASSVLAENIKNWPAPATWSPTKSRGVSTLDVTYPLPFIGLAPCRIVDTRGNGAPITGGIFTGGADVRVYNMAGICGVPAHARAVSLNFTVTGPGQTTPGFLVAWPTGGAVPPVSILNWDHVQAQIANAAIVPTGSGNSVAITVNVSAPTHLLVDINGYYYDGLSDFQSGTSLAAGEQFVLVGNVSGATANYAENISASAGSRGFRGVASGTTGASFGVYGQSFSTSTGTSGVRGEANATTGIISGVEGKTFSATDGATGISGVDGVGSVALTPLFSFSTGVRGNGRNGGAFVTSTSGGFGAVGVRENSAGTGTAVGVLGYQPGATAFGVYAFIGDVGCTSCLKSFVDPHPTDPTKSIHYVSLEGNEAGTYFRGTARTVDGSFVIHVPEDFRMVTDPEGLTVQLTPVGYPATMYVVSEDLNQIIVNSSADVKFHYLVQGIRPAFKDFKAIHDDGLIFMPQTPDGKMPEAWSAYTKKRLIANGSYNEDGTVNMRTAERVGWAKIWQDQAEEARAVAAAKAAEHAAKFAEQANGKR